MQTVLESKGLSFADLIRYNDIAIVEGSVTFIHGASGSGKSTLLRLFNATLSPSGGTILYYGDDISAIDSLKLRREVLLIGQSVYLFDTTIKENFDEFYSYRGETPPDEAQMLAYLRMCQLDMPLDTKTTSMSGGERQRAFAAIGLSFNPKVLMMDEPTSALDSSNAAQLLGAVIKYCKEHGHTVIVVSHDNQLVNSFAETIVEVKK